MKISLLNHACFCLSHGSVSIVTDPWLSGSILDGAWKLYTRTNFSSLESRAVNYIWLSHAHPDHFSTSCLNKIVLQNKHLVSVLGHAEMPISVKRFFENSNVEFISLGSESVDLGPDLRIISKSYKGGDSWAYFSQGNTRILNTNDCQFNTDLDVASVKRHVGDVDVLMTKFSYGAWAGDPEDVEYRKNKAHQKLNSILLQARYFKPRYIIPFASNNFFCHEENYYLNEHINSPRDAFNFIKKETDATPVILYSGDEFDIDSLAPHSSSLALNKFDKDIEKIKQKYVRCSKLLTKNPNIPFEKIEEIFKINPIVTKRKLTLYLTDHQFAIELNSRDGYQKIDLPYERCDVALSTESLLRALNSKFGFDYVRLSGRLRAPKSDQLSAYNNFFSNNYR